jgi:hypothetical protein
MSVSEQIADTLHSYGGVLGLITLMSHPNDSIRENASLALGNLARCSAVSRDSIVNSDGGLESFIPLLSSKNEKLQKNTIFIVGMLSSNDKFCEVIEKHGGLPILIKLLQKQSTSSSAPTAASSIFDDNAPLITTDDITTVNNQKEALKAPSMNTNIDVQQHVLHTLVNISSNGYQNREAIVKSGGVPILLSFINRNPFDSADVGIVPTNIQEAVLMVLANLALDEVLRLHYERKIPSLALSNLFQQKKPNL